MSFRRSDGPADRAESERLLDTAREGRPPAARADPLVHLLAAAAAPGNPGELSGEEQALAAFRAARATAAPVPHRAPRPRRLRVGVAAWVAGLAATATAGVAFAAVSLDRPQEPVAPPAPGTPGSTGSGTAGSPTGAGGPTGGAPGSAAPSTGSAPTGGPGRPAGTEQLAGLCRAYLAKPLGQRDRALATAAFADVVAAAGGTDRVDGFCARLVPNHAPKPSPSVRVTRSSAPTAAASPATVPSPGAPTTGKPSTGPGR